MNTTIAHPPDTHRATRALTIDARPETTNGTRGWRVTSTDRDPDGHALAERSTWHTTADRLAAILAHLDRIEAARAAR